MAAESSVGPRLHVAGLLAGAGSERRSGEEIGRILHAGVHYFKGSKKNFGLEWANLLLGMTHF